MEHIKVGRECHDMVFQQARVIGMPAAEFVRRAVGLYVAITRHPTFWVMVARLNGRKLADVLLELLTLWARGEVVLPSDPK